MSVAVLPRMRMTHPGRPRRAAGVWLRSPRWDLTFLILSAALVPIPLLLYHGTRRLADGRQPHRRRPDRRAAPVLDVHVHVHGAELPPPPPALSRGVAGAARDRHDDGVRQPAGAADGVLHVGVGPRAAPDHVHQRLLRRQGRAAAACARAPRGLRRRLPLPVSDGDAADPRRLLSARRDGALRPRVGDAGGHRRRADRRRRAAVRGVLRAVGGEVHPRPAPRDAARPERAADRPDDRDRLHAAAVSEHRRRLPGLQRLALRAVSRARVVPDGDAQGARRDRQPLRRGVQRARPAVALLRPRGSSDRRGGHAGGVAARRRRRRAAEGVLHRHPLHLAPALLPRPPAVLQARRHARHGRPAAGRAGGAS